MSGGYRVRGGGSSGGGGTAVVAWGPNWGGTDGDQYTIGVETDMPALGLASTLGVGSEHTMPALAVSSSQGIGSAHSMPSLGVSGALGIGAAHDMPEIAVASSQGVGVAPAMPALAASASKTVGVGISGTVLGAPFYRSIATTEQTSNSTSVAVSKPSGTVENDVLVAGIGGASASSESWTPPSGWTLIRQTNNSSTIDANLGTFYKVAGSSEPSSYTWTGGNNAAHIAWIMRFDGADTSTPVDVSGENTGNSTDPVAPSITTTQDNVIKIACCAQVNSTSQTYTPPSGYTERSDLQGSNLALVQVTGESATRPQASAGASGTATMNSNQVVGTIWAAQHIAIAPGEKTIA